MPPHLSPREHEVLRLVAQGMMIKQIAALMNLSHDTVEKYAVTMRTRIHAKTTAHAVAIGYQEGLLP